MVRGENPDIGLATVYRSLELFTSLDLVKKLDFGDGRSRYELNDHNLSHSHHHLICLGCGRVIEFTSDFAEEIRSRIRKMVSILWTINLSFTDTAKIVRSSIRNTAKRKLQI